MTVETTEREVEINGLGEGAALMAAVRLMDDDETLERVWVFKRDGDTRVREGYMTRDGIFIRTG